MTKKQSFITPTPDNLSMMMQRGVSGPLTMLNLMRFRETADYAQAGIDTASEEQVSGVVAYRRYFDAIKQPLADAGGEVTMVGRGGSFLIGPLEERWDAVLLISFPDLGSFVSFTSKPEYAQAAVHRTAALHDSRLLPLEPDDASTAFLE